MEDIIIYFFVILGVLLLCWTLLLIFTYNPLAMFILIMVGYGAIEYSLYKGKRNDF